MVRLDAHLARLVLQMANTMVTPAAADTLSLPAGTYSALLEELVGFMEGDNSRDPLRLMLLVPSVITSLVFVVVKLLLLLLLPVFILIRWLCRE